MLVAKTASPEETIRLGAMIGKFAVPGLVICLWGDLGAGKTQLAKGVALGLGIEQHVTSPTFNLINEYMGRLPFYHMDLYRLGDSEEAWELGLEEYFYGEGLSLVEWPERLGDMMPGERLDIRLTYLGEQERQLELLPQGRVASELVEELNTNVRSGN